MWRHSITSERNLLLFSTFLVLVCLPYSHSSSESTESQPKHPEAHEVPKHTTGPNCWIDKQPRAELAGIIPGNENHSVEFTVEDVENHVGRPNFVNITESYYSCVDGRYRAGIIATAGGDAAEFLLALNVAQKSGLTMNQFVVSGLFDDYMDFVGPFRKFYMHTDDHSWNGILERLNLTASSIGNAGSEEFLRDPPDFIKTALLNELTQPSGVGCGHLKLILKDPETAMTEKSLSIWFLNAFFQYMWLQDAARLKEDRKLQYVVLEGSHRETAVIEIYKTGCPGLAPAVASDTEHDSFFVHHAAATQILRENLAEFILKQYPETLKLTKEEFVEKMTTIGGIQLTTTLGALAKGLPLFNVYIEAEQIQNWHAVIGLICYCVAAWILGAILGVIVWKNPKGTIELETVARIIGEGSETVVKSVSIIVFPLYAFISIMMWVTMSWTLMFDFLFATSFLTVSCLAVLRFSSSCNVRTVYSVVDKSMFDGFLLAYKSSLVVCLIGCSPLMIMIAIMRLWWEASENIITFGFGGSIVLLLLRIGGSIFAISTQTSYEKLKAQEGTEVLQQMEEERKRNEIKVQFASPRQNSPKNPKRSISNLSTFQKEHHIEENRGNMKETCYDPISVLHCLGDVVDNGVGLTLEVSDSILMSLVSALAIGTSLYGVDGMALPFWLLAIGMASSVFSSVMVLIVLAIFGRNASVRTIFNVMKGGWVFSSLMYIGLAAAANFVLHFNAELYGAIVIGHCSRLVMLFMAEATTSNNIIKTDDLEEKDTSIHSSQDEENTILTLLLKALLVGMSSSLTPVFIVFTVLLSTGYLAGQFGISIAVLSMMATGNTSMCYNAISSIFSASRRIGEMTAQSNSCMEKLKSLESLGHRCSNAVKFFSTGSSALVSFSLFVAVAFRAGPDSVDLMRDPQVLPGLVLGAMMPFLFSSLTMMTLSRVAKSILSRAAFEDANHVMGSESKSHRKVAAWAIYTSMVHLLVPTSFAISLPVAIYVILREEVLIGFIGGALLSGSVMSSTLVGTGAVFSKNRENFLSTSLMDAGGPSINVLTKFCCVVALMSTMTGAHLFFVVLMVVCFIGMIASVVVRKLRKKYGWNYKFNFMALVNEENFADEEEEVREVTKLEDENDPNHFEDLPI